MSTVQVGNLEVEDWRKHFPDSPKYNIRLMSRIKMILVHHSVTGNLSDFEAAERIYVYHHDTLEWPGSGYHFLVGQDGAYLVGGIETVRYHAGTQNPYAVGVCFLGTFTHEPPDEAQLEHGRELIENLRFGLGWSVPVFPHRRYSPTACPGKTWQGLEPLLS